MAMNKIQLHPSYIYAKQVVNDEIEPPQLYYELNGEKKLVSPNNVKFLLMLLMVKMKNISSMKNECLK